MFDERAAETSLLQALWDAQRGDERALGVLLEHVLPIARSWCLGRLEDPGLRDLVDDIVQETGIRIVKHVETCRASSTRELAAWVLAIAHRESIRLLDRNWLRYRAVLEAGGRHQVEQAADAEVVSASREVGTLLSEAYDRLPERAQELIYLRLMEGRRWAEIGTEFDTTAGAAKRRYQRALARLKKEVVAAGREAGSSEIVLPGWLDE